LTVWGTQEIRLVRVLLGRKTSKKEKTGSCCCSFGWVLGATHRTEPAHGGGKTIKGDLFTKFEQRKKKQKDRRDVNDPWSVLQTGGVQGTEKRGLASVRKGNLRHNLPENTNEEAAGSLQEKRTKRAEGGRSEKSLPPSLLHLRRGKNARRRSHLSSCISVGLRKSAKFPQ